MPEHAGPVAKEAPATALPAAGPGRANHALLRLQHTAGNAAVVALLQRSAPADVIRRNWVDRPTDIKTVQIERIGTVDGVTIYYTKSGAAFHVEAYEKVDGVAKQIGIVDILPGNPTVLHTHSDEQGGRGQLLVGAALKTIAKYHCAGDGAVQLPMGGGAIVKLMFSKLSAVFGDPKLHAEAEKLRLARKAKKPTGPTGKSAEPPLATATATAATEPAAPPSTSSAPAEHDLDTFDPRFLEEHMTHVQAVLSGKYGGDIDIVTPLGHLRVNPEAVDDATLGTAYADQLLRFAKINVTIPNALFRVFAASL